MSSKNKTAKIHVQGMPISLVREGEEDYISLTGILKFKKGEFAVIKRQPIPTIFVTSRKWFGRVGRSGSVSDTLAKKDTENE